MSAVATVQEAEKEARLAGELVETLEKRVKSGDVSVTPAQLAEARELRRFAELRIEAAEQRAAAARQDALDERGAALRAQAERLADAGDREIAVLFKDAVAALARLVRVAGERRDVVREMARATEVLAYDAGTDWRGVRERYGVTADADNVRAGSAVVRVVTPIDVASAVVEMALDHYDRGQVLAVQRAGAVLQKVPAVAELLGMSERQVAAVTGPCDPGKDAALAASRERAADVSQ